MDINNLILTLVIGAIAGWLASTIMKRRGLGIVGNIVVGVIGAIVGGYLFGLLGLTVTGVMGSLITATVGAVALLYVVRLVKRA